MRSREDILADLLLYNIERLGDIQKDGIVCICNEEELQKLLFLGLFNKEELVSLRNILVEKISDRIDINRNVTKNFWRVEHLTATMTVVTGIIDQEIHKADVISNEGGNNK